MNIFCDWEHVRGDSCHYIQRCKVWKGWLVMTVDDDAYDSFEHRTTTFVPDENYDWKIE